MTQPAKSHEPSMEEILASIRRIIADDDVKPDVAAAPAPPPQKTASPAPANMAPTPAAQANPAPPAAKAPEPKPAPPPAAPAAVPNNQDDIDALLAGLDADTSANEVRPGAEPAAADEPDEDVLELTEQMEIDEEEPQSFQTIQPQDDIEFSEAEARPAEPRLQERPHVPVPPQVRASEEREPIQPLMSPQTVTAVNSAFNALAQTVLSSNARTLEDLVKEMLRPMLKSWLDDNLPGMVEKIVRAEIERVSRGG
jgi:cell pole-organizing protein PopZ